MSFIKSDSISFSGVMSYLGVVPVIGFSDALRMTSPLMHEKSTQKNTKRHQRLCADKQTGISQSPNKVVN